MATRVVPLIIHGEDILCHNEPTKVFLPNPDIPENGNERWLAQGATVKTCIDTVESCAKAFQSWRQTSLDERRALFTTLAAASPLPPRFL
jgi:acyl-CoA reductase-like NAD-dependent aldehyde dehydrogenase